MSTRTIDYQPMAEKAYKMMSITVGIPCFNEELTIEHVINDFKNVLPHADVLVVDNACTDSTSKRAIEAGATVIFEKRPGKGFALQKMFQYVKTDYLIIVDGDSTYDARDVEKLIKPVVSGVADMSVGNRFKRHSKGFSRSHRAGNAIFRWVLNFLFHTNYSDILSGYRVFSRDFYSTVPLLSRGFEVETELTLHSLERRFVVKEVPISYKDRPEGSVSKIREISDGMRIIFTIVRLMRDYRPMWFFSYTGLVFVLLGVLFGSIVIVEYLNTGFITRIPLSILSVALVIIGCFSILSGLILGTVNRRCRELEQLIINQNR